MQQGDKIEIQKKAFRTALAIGIIIFFIVASIMLTTARIDIATDFLGKNNDLSYEDGFDENITYYMKQGHMPLNISMYH